MVPFRGGGCGRWLGGLDASLLFFLWRQGGLLGFLYWCRNTYLRLEFTFFTSSPSVCETRRGPRLIETCLCIARDRDIRRYFFGN